MNGNLMRTLALGILAAAAFFLTPLNGYADNYTLTNTTYNWMNPVTITYNQIKDPTILKTDDYELTGHFTSENTGALPLYLNISDNGQPANWFTGFCVDIYQNIWGGANGSVSMIPVSKVHGGLQAAWLYNRYLDNAVAAAAHNDFAPLGGLQVAIWETVVDDYTNFNLNTGNFSVSGLNQVALTDANTYLADLKANFNATGLNSMYAIMYSTGLQDMLIRLPLPGVSDPPAGTPEPATMVLMGIGLIGLAGFVRHRKN